MTLCILVGCQEIRVSDDPTLRLTFEKDTVQFDTVFTSIGSSTKQVMIYNHNANALIIDRIWLDNPQSPFYINVDGESSAQRLHNLIINGGDSLFLFVRVNINPNNRNQPVLVEDNIHFCLNQHVQDIHLEAIGQDVQLIKTKKRLTIFNSVHFNATKPYLIYDTIAVQGQTTFDAGARLYFHDKAVLYAYGSVSSNGSLAHPVTMQGDRIDRLFDSVPYSYVAGMWGGVFLIMPPDATTAPTYQFNYTEIRSANVGLYCYCERTTDLPQLLLTNSLIHNHAVYGLVLQNIDAEVANSEISNAAAYCVYLAGGKQRFIHNTIASYFNNTNVRIQSVPREDAAAVYINNLSKNNAETQASFVNCIVDGVRNNNFVVATPLPQYYPFEIKGNYLKADSLQVLGAKDNVYRKKDDTTSVFVNNYYKYKEYKYYDFRLDSLSPARSIGDSISALAYPIDRLGNSRINQRPDAGCYQYR